MYGVRFGGGFGPVARQTAKRMNEYQLTNKDIHMSANIQFTLYDNINCSCIYLLHGAQSFLRS
jgi:hypothetical protein